MHTPHSPSKLQTLTDLSDLMAACLQAGETAWQGVQTQPASEDVRTVGITLFLEAMRRGLPLPDHLRFRRRCEELRRQLGEDAYNIALLSEFGVTDLGQVPEEDVDAMRAIVNSLEEELAARPPDSAAAAPTT